MPIAPADGYYPRMEVVVVVVLVAVAAVAYYLIERPLPRDFWKLAARHPDNAYDWFISHEGWVVVDPASPGRRKPDGPEFTEPFVLWVPKLGGRRVLVYGRRSEMSESQEAFIRVFGPYGE
jgi:hypothetical protein